MLANCRAQHGWAGEGTRPYVCTFFGRIEKSPYKLKYKSFTMASLSPTAEGFRILLRRPIIPLAEIAWRWTFAAAAWFLAAMFLLEYADTLPVKALDRLLLASQQPLLVGHAIQRIFEGSAFRFTKAGILLALALVLGWIVLASLGRTLTLRSLIEEFDGPEATPSQAGMASLLGLNFFRAAVALAAAAAGIGSLLAASSLWASTQVSVGDAARLWFALLLITAMAWSVLNWFLSTSAIFAVNGSEGAFQAIASAVHFSVERPGAFAAPGTWFGLIHFGAFLFACGAGFTVLGAAGVIGARPLLFLELLIVLVYSAVVDFLYIGRLAAYVAALRGNEGTRSPEPAMRPPGALPNESSAVDPGELILSDVPLSAT
ncbi:MAG: hypothetical protein DMG97_00275 [Acidobacteria bacterium]|nr:MAG: hypothetical protein DMG97_00275 [Acidobacteriota bacterium]